MKSTKIVKLIYTEDRRGLGKDSLDPIRLCPQLWHENGTLVAEYDPVTKDTFFHGLDYVE